MRVLTATLLLALVAGCVSPVERCRSAATRELRGLDRMIAEAERDIARGYRLRPVRVDDPFAWFDCVEEHRTPGFCMDESDRVELVREPLNLPSEQARLASLRQQRAAAEDRARKALETCPQV